MKYTRKRTYRKKRTIRRVKRSYNISGKRKANVLSLRRTVWFGSWTPSTGSTSGFWRYETPSINNITNLSEYQALFDQYKVNGIKVTYRPRYDSFAGNDTTDVTLPNVTNQAGCMVHIINDPESDVTPSGTYASTTLQAFFENGNVKTFTGLKPFSFFFKPRVSSTITTGSARMRCPWLQTKDNTTPLNGWHVFLQDNNLTGVFGQSFDIYLTFYIQFRGMK